MREIASSLASLCKKQARERRAKQSALCAEDETLQSASSLEEKRERDKKIGGARKERNSLFNFFDDLSLSKTFFCFLINKQTFKKKGERSFFVVVFFSFS